MVREKLWSHSFDYYIIELQIHICFWLITRGVSVYTQLVGKKYVNKWQILCILFFKLITKILFGNIQIDWRNFIRSGDLSSDHQFRSGKWEIHDFRDFSGIFLLVFTFLLEISLGSYPVFVSDVKNLNTSARVTLKMRVWFMPFFGIIWHFWAVRFWTSL